MTDANLTPEGDPAAAPEPTPAPAPAPAPAASPEPSAEPAAAPETDWRAGLPRKSRDFVEKSGYKTVADLAQAALHSNQLVSIKDRTGMLVRPEGDRESNPDAWKEIDSIYGIPEKAEDYEAPKIEGWEIPPDQLKTLQATAKQLGIPASGFGGFIEAGLSLLDGQAAQVAAAAKEQLEAEGKALADEWGADFDNNLASAQGVIREFGDAALVKRLEDTGLNQDPAMARMFHKLAQVVSEGGGLPGDLGGRGGARSVADIENDMAAFKQKHSDALYAKSHANHKWADKEHKRLHAELAAAKKTGA